MGAKLRSPYNTLRLLKRQTGWQLRAQAQKGSAVHPAVAKKTPGNASVAVQPKGANMAISTSPTNLAVVNFAQSALAVVVEVPFWAGALWTVIVYEG